MRVSAEKSSLMPEPAVSVAIRTPLFSPWSGGLLPVGKEKLLTLSTGISGFYFDLEARFATRKRF